MLKSIVLTISLLSSTFAYAYLPPKEYDHPYRGKLSVVYLDRLPMLLKCRSIACAHVYSPNRCKIYLPKFKTRDPLWVIRRHEIGHCNGWFGHEGMRPYK